MATVDPKATLALLMGLQRIDQDVWRLRQRIKETPLLLDRRAERFRQGEARVAASQARVTELRKQIGLLELDVKTKDGEILKIQGAQGQSRTNEEFRAFGDHVARLRKEKSALEDRILDHLGQIESIEKEQVDLKSTRDSLKKEVDADLAQWKKDEAEYQAELAARLAERAEFAKQVAPGPLSVYERVLKVRDGKAMVTADGKICGGCQMSITPNDFTRLHRGNELVACRNCERILYLTDMPAAVR
ncbi:MAG: hypothetical protein JNL90_07940 [Planctomycetes bacterium]|nr:hypothetical protein [Planctomycetota bacterium]